MRPEFSTRSSRVALCVLLLCGVLITAAAATGKAHAEAQLWDAIRSGQAFVMIRHAIAPGTGDPDEFRLGDCSTQRNLSPAGRQQARQIGESFRVVGITAARVLTSQWCRCRETAALLALGPVEDLPALNSFFENREDGRPQTLELEAWLEKNAGGDRPVVLVTHQVNITALTGIVPRSGGMVVARRDPSGRIGVLGQL